MKRLSLIVILISTCIFQKAFAQKYVTNNPYVQSSNVGFFKKIKNTEFAKADSKWFIPLCLTIGIFGILIQLMNK